MPEYLSEQRRRTRNVATLRTYFRLLAAMDIESWIELWADDCTVHAPYAVGDIPSVVNGRENLLSFYRSQAAGYQRLDYPDTEIYPLEDPDRVVARWYPRAELVGGDTYENENVGLFEFDAAGAIRTFTEYFNPVGLAVAR